MVCVFVVVAELAPRGFSPVLHFPLLKNQHLQIPIRSGTHGPVAISASWVHKLHFPLFVHLRHLIVNDLLPFAKMKHYKDATWVGFLAVKKEHEKTLALLMKSQEEVLSDIVSWHCFRTCTPS